ncbi:MAG: chemotaxis protein CheB [Bacteroidales bacterium]|jgi:two-component system chemotaxis response regulator CheB
MNYKAIVIGASTGGFYALRRLITALPDGFDLPILVVQHISPNSDNFMARYLDGISNLLVKEADEKEAIVPGTVYIAPPNYHMLVEEDFTIGLSTEEKIRYARPSIDVLFETAVFAYGTHLIGIVLTGANNDGAYGLSVIKKAGGLTIAQLPSEAEADMMPQSAIDMAKPHHILPIEGIARLLTELNSNKKNEQSDST